VWPKGASAAYAHRPDAEGPRPTDPAISWRGGAYEQTFRATGACRLQARQAECFFKSYPTPSSVARAAAGGAAHAARHAAAGPCARRHRRLGEQPRPPPSPERPKPAATINAMMPTDASRTDGGVLLLLALLLLLLPDTCPVGASVTAVKQAEAANNDNEPVDLTLLEDSWDAWAAQFRSGPGVGDFSFWPNHPTSAYGSCDMLISLVVLGREAELGEAQRDAWASTINQFQDVRTGMFVAQSFEPHACKASFLGSCDQEHTTAFCIAALSLIGRQPAWPLVLINALQANESAWAGWLADNPTQGSWDHRVSGVVAALAMTNTWQPTFRTFYFEWITEHATKAAGGFVCSSRGLELKAPPQLASATCYAHVNWQYAFANQSWSFATAMVDAALSFQNKSTGFFCVTESCTFQCAPANPQAGACGGANPTLPSCHQLDAIWLAARSSALAHDYRREDVISMCRSYLRATAQVFRTTAVLMNRSIYGDSHGLQGAIESIAECLAHFPTLAKTRRNWVSSLTRAPFM
jgi:hypothetical protein